MSFVLILGSMGAGKTSNLKSRIDNVRLQYKLKQKNPNDLIIFVNHIADKERYGTNILTHCGIRDDKVVYINSLEDVFKQKQYKTTEYIFINELQMFSNNRKWLIQFLKHGKYIVACGLLSNKDQNLWPSISEILPLASETIHLKAFCSYCIKHNATMTILNKKPSVDACKKANDQKNKKNDNEFSIAVGSFQDYEPICLSCWLVINKKDKPQVSSSSSAVSTFEEDDYNMSVGSAANNANLNQNTSKIQL